MAEEWRAKAKCRGVTPGVFFPREDSFDATRAAKTGCSHCPVIWECYEDHQNEPYGVWGGTSEQDRQRLRRSNRGPQEIWAQTQALLHPDRKGRYNKAAIWKMYADGMSLSEISERLDAPHSTVWSIVKRRVA